MPQRVKADKILAVLSRSPRSWLATLTIVERTGLSMTVVAARLRELEGSCVEKRRSSGDSRATSNEWRLLKKEVVAA